MSKQACLFVVIHQQIELVFFRIAISAKFEGMCYLCSRSEGERVLFYKTIVLLNRANGEYRF